MNIIFDVDNAVMRIAGLVKKAEEAIAPKLRAVNNIVSAVKEGLSSGVDTIPTEQATEWLVALAIVSADLSPQREAFELTKALWKLETDKLMALRMRDRGAQKKVDVETESTILFIEHDIQKAVAEYMSKLLKSTRDDISELIQTLKRVVDERNYEEKR